jgi:uncharacterized surface anchored protein
LSVTPLGTYKVSGLPVPGTYTVTFSRPDLADVTQAIDLDPFSRRDVTGINASLPDATGAVAGTVHEVNLGGPGVGEVDISLSDGATTYRTKSATSPTPGQYLIPNVRPGTYTVTFARKGATPVSFIISIGAGQLVGQDAAVSVPASISGSVDFVDLASVHHPLPGAEVRLFVLSQYPNTILTKTTTDVNGNFSFTDLVAPESYLIEYAYPPGAPAQTTRTLFTISAGANTSVATVTLTT